jgi:hypothetical protein
VRGNPDVGRLFASHFGSYNCQKVGTDPGPRTIQEEREMISAPSRMAAIFVDRACTEHWVVRDPEGNFWIVPSVENAWECRRPFQPAEDTELEPIPGHYRFMLGLPF